jgi:uncharacterized membrane protein
MEMAVSTATAQVRRIEFADLRWAIDQGWSDFKAKRGDLIILPIIYPVAGFLVAFFMFNQNLFALIFPVIGGFALLGPIAAAGFYELARRREAGEDPGWGHFLDPMMGRSQLPLIGLALLLAAIFLVWLLAAQAIYGATLGQLAPADAGAFLAALIGTSQGWAMIIIGNLVGAIFATCALAMGAFSFPMVVDTGASASTALRTSLAAFRASPATLLQWGGIVAITLGVAPLPLLVGLVVALPWLGYATWHLYTRAVVR